MLKAKPILAILLIAAALAVCAGCENSYANKKNTVKQQWEKNATEAKIPIAWNLFENGRIDEARQTLQECLDVDAENPQAHLLMGRIHFSQGRLAQARRSFSLATEFDSSSDKAWYWLGRLAQHNDKLTDALSCYYKAMSLKPADVDYITAAAKTYAAQKQYSKAITLLEQKFRLLPSQTDLKVTAADIMLSAGRTTEAIDMYKEAMLLEPGDLDIIESLGYCYIMNQQWGYAGRMFEELADKSTGERKKVYLRLLGTCSINNSEYGKAFSCYDELSVVERDNANLWLQMGQAALGADAPNRAIACAERALRLKPGWADAVALMGCAHYMNADYHKAIKTFGKIISNNDLGGFAWLMTGRCYQQLGEFSPAQKAYGKSAGMNPASELLVTLFVKPQEHNDPAD